MSLPLPDDPVAERRACVQDGYARGWSFTPLTGKKPANKGWLKAPRERRDQALQWAEQGNIGIRTGGHSGGLIVIDVDAHKGGTVSGLELPSTVTVISGGGGRHFYYRSNERYTNARGRLPPRIDVRGEGGQIVAAGSIHPDTGRTYSYEPGRAPWEVAIAELPASIAALLRGGARPTRRMGGMPVRKSQESQRILVESCDLVRTAPEGTRNNTLNATAHRLARLVRDGHLGRTDVERALTDASPLPPAETAATIKSALDAGIANAAAAPALESVFNLTDAGNAERFAAQHRERAAYDTAAKSWRLWNGCRWEMDPGNEVINLAIQTARSIGSEGAGCPDEQRRRRLIDFARGTEKATRLHAMVDLGRALPGMSMGASGWDQDRFKFNVLNGTVDLRTGTLGPHNPRNRMTRLANVEFDAGARYPRFHTFLLEIFENDRDLIDYVQRFLGMCLTGDVSEQCLHLLLGRGANGKSTLVETIAEVMGDYAAVAAPDLLTVRRNEEHPTEIADLAGRRFVIASETDKAGRFALQRLKRLTGDEKLKGRWMHGDYFEFSRLFKLVLLTNNAPQVDENSEATWRRIRVVPFNYVVPEDRRDRRLAEHLRAERAGILQWLLEGCRAWLRIGLGEPAAVTAATAHYRRSATPASQFLAERCERSPTAWCSSSMLESSYKAWCDENGLFFESPKSLPAALRGCGCTDKKRGHARGWAGVRLRN